MKLPLPNLLSDASAALQRALGGAAPDLAALKDRLPDALRGLLDRPTRPVTPPRPDAPPMVRRHYAGAGGSRPYSLFVPSAYHGQAVPLIVMLHGCSQSPDDFAAGTRMNLAADAQTCLVAWPQQVKSANMQACWNWFRTDHQQRGHGEPAVVAGIVRQVMEDFAIDPSRVYVAGLSAGGAAAAVLGQAYPDLFAAIGVHSGLPSGAAADLPSALRAMKLGSRSAMPEPDFPPAIIFHGDADSTVHPANGEAMVAQAMGTASLQAEGDDGAVPGGKSWHRTRYRDAGGRTRIEHWQIAGGGHAWSGGSTAGSFTDPSGPDATAAMLRFFLDHRLERQTSGSL